MGLNSGYRGKVVRPPSALTRRVLARVANGGPAEPARVRSAPSLEEVTLDYQTPSETPPEPIADLVGGQPCAGQFGVKVVQYPDGVRACVYRGRSPKAPGGSVEDAVASEGSSIAPEVERSAASTRRSRALVAHRVRCLGPHSMWTFTKRGKFSSSDELWRTWVAFTRLCERRYGRRIKYVAVPELHGDGDTWHLHVVLGERFEVEALRILWHRALGGTGRERGSETPGNVDVKTLRGHRASARRIAAYISKYVGKGFERSSSNRRVFSASAGLNPTRVEFWRCPWDAAIGDVADFARRRLCESFGVALVYARFLLKPDFQCAVLDCTRPARA